MPTSHPMLRAIGTALDALDVAMCVFDAQDKTLVWNQRFLDFFPEHDGHVRQGEPYADNLRRFYRCRLTPEEMPNLERHVAEGVARHRAQSQPFDFDHRGVRLRASSIQAGRVGRVRLWRKTMALPISSAPTPFPPPLPMSLEVIEALECIADGALIVDAGGLALWANANFRLMYGIPLGDDIRSLNFAAIYRRAWRADAPTQAFQLACTALRERERLSGAPYEMPLPDNRWTLVTERWGGTADGRGYSSHVDITALKRQQHELAGAQKRLKALANTDGLTGLRNRTSFDAALFSEWRRASRGDGALSLLMIDIDHFKDLNDQHGHLTGDDVLKSVAAEIGAHARRAGDVVARFGGEEFVMLLPHTDGPTAAALAESLRAAVASMETTSHKGVRLGVTISIGVSTAAGDLFQQSPEVLVEQADLALYGAKRAGRNRVATHVGSKPLTEV